MEQLSSEKKRIIRLPDVKSRTGLAVSSIYSKIDTGDFPEPISLGARSVGWLEDEIDAWISKRIKASRGE